MSASDSVISMGDPEYKKLAARAKRYGLTPFQLQALLLLKKGCWICDREPKSGRPRYIDHNHKTGAVRGVLCFTCNYKLLGRGLDQAWLHEAATKYLRYEFDARKDL